MLKSTPARCTSRTVQLILLIATSLVATAPARAAFTTIALPALDTDIATWVDGATYEPLFPGNHVFNGVPFTLAEDGNGNKAYMGGEFTLDVNLPAVTTVYTIINSAFGTAGTTLGSITFNGNAGAVYTADLVEGINVRDHYRGGFNNVIDGVSALPAVDNGAGRAALDMQIFELPNAFAGQTLLTIVYSPIYNGLPGGDPFLAAVTVSAVPLPASAWLLPPALLVLAPSTRRRRLRV